MRSVLVFLLLAGVSASAALVALMLIFTKYWGVTDVGMPPPETFPVLLVQPGPTCTAVLWRDLDAAKEGDTAWSYLAPTSELAACKSQLRPDAAIVVGPTEDGRQSIALSHSPGGDEVNLSRYLAAPGAIEPISHQRYFGPFVALTAAAASVVLGATVGAVGTYLDRRRRAD